MPTTCPTCRRPVTENACCELRGALCYHMGCAPTSAGSPGTIWQAFLHFFGVH